MNSLKNIATVCLFGIVLWSCSSGKKDRKQQVAVNTLNKELNINNPIIRDEYTADPAALVYNDTVYLYAGHDQAPVDNDLRKHSIKKTE